MNPNRKIASNFITLFSGEFFARILGFFATAYLARTLGIEGFGKINFAIAIVGYFILLTTWGFDIYAIREVSKKHSLLPKYLSNIQLMRFSIGLIVYAFLFLFVSQWDMPETTKILLYIYGLSVFTLPLNIAWTFYAMENMKTVAISTVINQVVFLCIVLLFVKSIDEIHAVAWAYILGELIAVFATVYIFFRIIGRVPFKFDLTLCKEIFVKSLPFGISRILRIFTLSSGIIVIGFIASETDVGIYSAAHRVVLLLATICLYYHFSLYPTISKAYKEKNLEHVGEILATASRLSIMLALPMAVGGVLLSEPIIQLIFGAEYQTSDEVFSISVWMAALLMLSGNYSYTLLALDQQKTAVRIMAYASVINVILNLVLVYRYGIYGAAITAVLTEAYILVVSVRKVSAFGVSVPIFKHIPRALLSSLVMAYVLYIMEGMNLALLIITGVLTYFIMMIATKGIIKIKE